MLPYTFIGDDDMVKMETSKLICEECGAIMQIPRKRGQRREKGHIKHMYCYKCKKKTAFIEGVAKEKNLAFWEEWQENHLESEDDVHA